jgi:hypothetical protein
MQVVPQAFTDHAQGQVRKLSWVLRMSFDKAFNDSTVFFKLDSSILDGPDILQPSGDNPIQVWDYYDYKPFTDRVIMMEWTRELEFPNSVINAMADFTVDNHDDYFTPDSGSPIDQFISPKRPVRLLSGFDGTNIPQFVGLTEKMPVLDDNSKTASFHAIDFLSQLFKMEVNQTVAMQDARTDEVLAAIFAQFGLAPEQYNLPVCRNIIPFVFFEKGVLAGEVIRQLMQAEMGNLWLDEQGIIQLQPRVSVVLDPVYSFDSSNVIDIKTKGDSNIINTVKIDADIRAVQDYQVVFSKTASDSNLFVIAPGESREFEADLQDPCLTVTTPTFGIGSGPSWFTAETADEAPVTTGMTITAHELRTNSYVFTIANANAYAVNIDQAELWGQPAKVIDTIAYTEVNQPSIDKYEENVLPISNPFIQSLDQCDSLAFSILEQFARYANEVEMTVKGNPALQLGDIVDLDVRSYSGAYRITKTYNKLQDGCYAQVLTARKVLESPWFVLDRSLLDGDALLTP